MPPGLWRMTYNTGRRSGRLRTWSSPPAARSAEGQLEPYRQTSSVSASVGFTTVRCPASLSSALTDAPVHRRPHTPSDLPPEPPRTTLARPSARKHVGGHPSRVRISYPPPVPHRARCRRAPPFAVGPFDVRGLSRSDQTRAVVRADGPPAWRAPRHSPRSQGRFPSPVRPACAAGRPPRPAPAAARSTWRRGRGEPRRAARPHRDRGRRNRRADASAPDGEGPGPCGRPGHRWDRRARQRAGTGRTPVPAHVCCGVTVRLGASP